MESETQMTQKKSDTTKYTTLKAFGGEDGKTHKTGSIVSLGDEEAKRLHKHKAIGLYIAGDDEAPDAALPKPKRPKPAAPVALPDEQLMTPDPKAK